MKYCNILIVAGCFILLDSCSRSTKEELSSEIQKIIEIRELAQMNPELYIGEIRDEIRFREIKRYEKGNDNKVLMDTSLFMVQDTIIIMTDSGFSMQISSYPVEANAKFNDVSTDSLKFFLEPKVVYKEDNRKEYWELDPTSQSVVSTVVCFIKKNRLTLVGEEYVLDANRYRFEDKYKTCQTERFKEQPTGGFCTGFAVSERVIVTAGHCISNSINDFYIIFDYHLVSNENPRLRFPTNLVYEARRLIQRELNDVSKIDYAILEVNKPIESRRICTLRMDKITGNESLFVAGHPVGLPLKIAGGAKVQNANTDKYYVADLDTYGGNSGSPVFDQNSQVAGILVRGAQDFVYSVIGNCNYTNVCPRIINNRKCGGEEVTRNSQFLPYLENSLRSD